MFTLAITSALFALCVGLIIWVYALCMRRRIGEVDAGMICLVLFVMAVGCGMKALKVAEQIDARAAAPAK